MIVYHGSWLEVKNPDLKHSRSDVDFGKGFYVTPLRDQAVKWCGKFKRMQICFRTEESLEHLHYERSFEV